MDIAPPNQHPATSDDELAKVLAGIGADDSAAHTPTPQGKSSAEAAGLQFEETPGPLPAPAGGANVNNPIAPQPAPGPLPDAAAPVPTPVPQPGPTAVPSAPLAGPEPALPTLPSFSGVAVGGLDDLKKTALSELRPLVGKLDLPPEDRFDTLLLIIRSTDDQSLLEPAHEAAKAIPDETKRAQALLDVIKEIDYFSQAGQPPALAA
jgi:hypothetical protein